MRCQVFVGFHDVSLQTLVLHRVFTAGEVCFLSDKAVCAFRLCLQLSYGGFRSHPVFGFLKLGGNLEVCYLVPEGSEMCRICLPLRRRVSGSSRQRGRYARVVENRDVHGAAACIDL